MSEQSKGAHSHEVPPSIQMVQLIIGYWVSRALYVAAELGLADLLEDRPRTVEELAERTETHAPSLYRLMRALASVGVFAEDEDRRFALTPLGATLRSSVPGSLRAFAISELGRDHYASWTEVLHSVRTGETAFDHVFKQPVWEYYAEHPEESRVFNESMSNLTVVVEKAVLESYDFSPFRKIVDVGGGHGSFLSAILKKNVEAEGVVFDSPQVIEGTGERLESGGLSARCTAVGGDFFEAVPEGGDAYTMKFILHDWNDEQSVAILKSIHRAMKPDGRLVVVETVVPRGNEPSFSKFMDLNMLVMTGGRERTEDEWRALFAEGGFRLTRIFPTASPVSVIEAVRA